MPHSRRFPDPHRQSLVFIGQRLSNQHHLIKVCCGHGHEDLHDLHVWTTNQNLTVKRPGRSNAGSKTSERFVAAITPSFPIKTIHFNQQLVQCLFPLIMSATHTGTTLATDCIDFIDKDDGWCIFFAVSNKSRTRLAPTDKHFNEI